MSEISELKKYRELLRTNIKKDIRGKYKASFLGVLWSFINPLLQVLVYAIVFPHLVGISNTGDNYVVYLITGIIPWSFFQSVLVTCVSCIKNNAGIIKKVYFPREILPVSAACSGLINFFISCLIIVIFLIVYRVGISWHIIFVPLIAVIEMIMTLGFGFMFAAFDAYFQDLEYIINFILQLAFYGSPIVYQLSMFSESRLMWLIMHNPLTQLILAYRDAFMYHAVPNLRHLGYVAVFAVVVLLVGLAIFKKLEKGFAEQF